MRLTVPLEKVGRSWVASLVEVDGIHQCQFVPGELLLDSSPANADINVLILLGSILIINIRDQAVKIILELEYKISRVELLVITKDRWGQP